MDCNKSDLPKGSFPKIDVAEKKFLNKEFKIDSPLLNKIDSDQKRAEVLSAKEQESRRKFKEKLNKLKKMPLSPQSKINVNSEGLTEGELTIENVKRKFKQIFSKIFKESLPSAMPELEKTIGKKQPNNIKIHRFGGVVPIKQNDSSAGKHIESMICKSVGLLPEQYISNGQILLISKDKEKFVNGNTTGNSNNEHVVLPSTNDKKPVSTLKTPENPIRDISEKVKALEKIITETAPAASSSPLQSPSPSPSPSSSPKSASTPAPAQAPAPSMESPSGVLNDNRIMLPKKYNEKIIKETTDDKPAKLNLNITPEQPDKEKKLQELVTKGEIKVNEKSAGIVKVPLAQKTSASVSGGILSNMLKNFSIFKSKSWFSGKNKETKMKMPLFPFIQKIPLRWRHGAVIIGTFIPLYYTYHKIVTNNKLTFMLSEEN